MQGASQSPPPTPHSKFFGPYLRVAAVAWGGSTELLDMSDRQKLREFTGNLLNLLLLGVIGRFGTEIF